MDCRWNLCRVSWLDWPAAAVGRRQGIWPARWKVAASVAGALAGAASSGRGACMGADSISTTGGAPILISRPKMSEGVGTASVISSSCGELKDVSVMPLGTEMPALRQPTSSLETWASSLGAVAVYCRYSSRLLLTSLMALERAHF